MAKRAARPRIVAVECPTPALYRWFLGNLRGAARSHPEGFVVDDEDRWAMVLRGAEGRELWADIRIPDKSRGEVVIRLRDGVVVCATGSEPERYIGLTLDGAKHLARFGAAPRSPGAQALATLTERARKG